MNAGFKNNLGGFSEQDFETIKSFLGAAVNGFLSINVIETSEMSAARFIVIKQEILRRLFQSVMVEASELMAEIAPSFTNFQKFTDV